jgi:hypothetical protein
MTPRRLFLFATLMAFSATAAIAQDSSSASGTPASSGTGNNPTKKVWTNDDVAGAHESASAFSPASPNSKPGKGSQSAAGAKGRDAKWYHDQIAKLEAQVPPLDSQIADLQAAIDGKPTGDGKESERPRFVKGGDWATELTQLRSRRVDLLSKIDALQDQARRNGVPDNALP